MAPKMTLQHSPDDYVNLGIQLGEDLEEPQKKITENQMVETACVDEDRFRVSPKPPRERRNWKRFAIDGAVVMVAKPSFLSALKPSYVKLGPVKDIGMKGLAVHYVETNEPAIKKADHLSIVFPGGRTVVDKLPFKIVNQFRVGFLPGGKEVWSLCVSFGRLHPMQKIQIESFIDDYGNELEPGWVKEAAGSEG